MKILFLATKPSDDLKKALLSQDFVVEVAAGLPRKTESASAKTDPDLIVFFPHELTQIDTLGAIRKMFSSAWICVVAREKWLREAEPISQLLRRTEINDLLVENVWESQFWFSVQHSLRRRQETNELESHFREMKQLKKTVEELNDQSQTLVRQLDSDIGLAANIQRALMPKFSPEIPGVSIAVKYIPAAGLGGDYYDIFEFGDKKRFGLLLADAKTHGIAASLLSVLVKVRLEEMKDRFPDSKSFVEYLNRELQQLHEKQLAPLSLLYGIFDRASLTLQYTVAGTIKPILWRMGEAPEMSISLNPPLGGIDQYSYQENFLRLQPGDIIIFHTDGLHNPFGGNAPAKILELLKNLPKSPQVREIQNEIIGIIDSHVEQKKLKDDVTVIHLGIDEKLMYLAPAQSK